VTRRASTEIDWLAVEMVCNDGHSLKLRHVEAMAVIRRLDERMLAVSDPVWDIPPGKLTSQQVAQRLRTTDRSVMRWRKDLPPATKATCAACGQTMWVLHDGHIEPHPNHLFKTCNGGQSNRESAYARTGS
jgi:hypothetical protein